MLMTAFASLLVVSASIDEVQHRFNYGVLFTKVPTPVQPSIDYWGHMFVVTLEPPVYINAHAPCGPLPPKGSNDSLGERITACQYLFASLMHMRQVRRDALRQIGKTINHIKEIVPDTMPNITTRDKRSLLHFVGTAFSKLFGLISESDFNKMAHQIEAIKIHIA